MRRFARRLFTLCSLVLCVGVCVLWVRSYPRTAHFLYVHFEDHPQYDRQFAAVATSVWSERGVLTVNRAVWLFITLMPPPPPPPRRLLGFGFVSTTRDLAPRGSPLPDESPLLVPYTSVEVPHWALVLLTGVLPARQLLRLVRTVRSSRRDAAGRCPACGYDLRATPGRCPECGTENAG